MNEKNDQGKTPLQLFDTSASSKDYNNFVTSESMFTAMLDTLRLRVSSSTFQVFYPLLVFH